MTRIHFVPALFFAVFVSLVDLKAEEEVRAAVHVHTRWSDGALTIREVAEQARSLGLGAVVLSDSYERDARWGPPPLQGLVFRTQGLCSVRRGEVARWLEEIEEAHRAVPEVAIVPGVEVAPVCQWTGAPWNSDLRAEGLHLHLLAIGVRPAEAFEDLPVPTDGPIHLKWSLARRCALAGLTAVALLVLLPRRNRLAASAAALIALAWFPVRRGEIPEVLPAREAGARAVTSARRWGMFISWAHPEALAPEVETMVSGVRVRTRRYPDRLLLSPATAFPSVYGDVHSAAGVGREWDAALLDYVEGRRDMPLWGIGEADFHGTGAPSLDRYQTVVLADARTAPAIERALGRGSCYAAMAPGGKPLSLSVRVTDSVTGASAGMGGKLIASGPVRVHVEARGSGTHGSLAIVLQGRLWKETSAALPLVWDETLAPAQGLRYLRATAASDSGALSAGNPVFVEGR